jgi:hypothetical protein
MSIISKEFNLEKDINRGKFVKSSSIDNKIKDNFFFVYKEIITFKALYNSFENLKKSNPRYFERIKST